MIILIFITILSICVAFYSVKNKINIDGITEQRNKELLRELSILEEDKNKILSETNILENKVKNQREYLNNIQEDIKNTLDSQTQLSSIAFNNYCEILENQYNNKEKEFSVLEEQLESSYDNLQIKLLNEFENIKIDLEKIKSTRRAAIEAARREYIIENDKSSYCLNLSEEDIKDFHSLEELKKTFFKPRVISMLEWQTYFQKPLKALSAKLLGTSTVVGIYKITNLKTKECYIGQSVDIASRWTDHCKCGVGIDAPAGNKLYKAMKDYGIPSFSWELLEECKREELDDKEKFYIDLYQSYEFGYNSNIGISKKG